MTRARATVALAGALAVVATSFGVAAAGEKNPAVYFEGDCGCTGAARAADRAARIEAGIKLPVPAPATTQQP